MVPRAAARGDDGERRPAASAGPATATATERVKKAPGPCSKDPTVTFTDPTLEAAVRRQLQKAEGPIARGELGKVRTLDLSQAKRNDELDHCVFPLFTGVKGLYLAPGKLDDLSPIKTLTQIESLRISITQVKDLAPLAGLAKLDRRPDLGRTPVSDLRPLGACASLTELQIDETEVSNLAPLAKLAKLDAAASSGRR